MIDFRVNHYSSSSCMIDTKHRFCLDRPNYANRICIASSLPMHTPICMMIFSILTFIITVLHPRLWLHDSTTKAARRKCQRILSKQSKASELMQQRMEGEILVQISPLLFSRCTEYIFSPQLVPYLPRSLSFFFLSISDIRSEPNKPPSDVMKAGAVICEAPSFLFAFLPLFQSLTFSSCGWTCALHCYSMMTPRAVR